MWILPTRGRPHNIRRFIEACAKTETPTSLLIVIDADDDRLNEYRDIAYPKSWEVYVGERRGCNASHNYVFERLPMLDFYGILADDIVPETPNWSSRLERLAGKDGLAYGDDGINGEKLATHGCLGGDFVRYMGFIAYPGLERLYADNVWTDVARKKGVLRYDPDVKLTHYHFSNGLASKDETYRKSGSNNEKEIYERVKKRLDVNERL